MKVLVLAASYVEEASILGARIGAEETVGRAQVGLTGTPLVASRLGHLVFVQVQNLVVELKMAFLWCTFDFVAIDSGVTVS